MKQVKLSDLGTIITGRTPSKNNKDFYDSDDIPFLKPDNFENKFQINRIKHVNSFVSENARNKTRIVSKNSILVTCIGIIGKIAIVENQEVAFNQQINSITPNNNISTEYLAYALLFNRSKLQAIANAPVVPIVNKTQFSNFEIQIHEDIELQKRIVKILGLSYDLIEKRKKQIVEMDQLSQSVFYEMFGNPVTNSKNWTLNKLSAMGSIARGKSKHRPRNAPELLGGPYPLIQTGDVAKSGVYITEYKHTYSELGLKQSKMWQKGTLCITIAANIAKTGILSFDACFPDSVVGMICNENSNELFMHAWFGFFQKILEKNAPESAQKNINLKILENLDVICPPIELQNNFASIVEEIEEQKKVMEKSLHEMENNFNALMQKAFNGELFPE